MDAFATPRLKATKLAREDLPDLVQLHLDSEVSRFLGGVRAPSATATYLETNLRHWADRGLGLWTLRTGDGAFIGRAGLRHVELEGVLELELAYTFVRSAWGQGFATEASAAMVTYAFDDGDLDYLTIGHFADNPASARIITKLGFILQGEISRDCVARDEKARCLTYRLERGTSQSAVSR